MKVSYYLISLKPLLDSEEGKDNLRVLVEWEKINKLEETLGKHQIEN